MAVGHEARRGQPRNSQLERAIGDGLARWVAAVQARSRLVLVVALLSAVLSGVFTATHLGVNADQDDLFREDLPHLVNARRTFDAFPLLHENLVFVVDAPREQAASDGAHSLAAALERSDLFRGVFEPRGAFFEDRALLYLPLERLEDVVDELARAQPYLSGLARAPSVDRFASLVEDGIDGVARGAVEGESLAPMLDRISEVFEAQLRGERDPLGWEGLLGLAGADREPDSRVRRLIVAQPVLELGELAVARRAIREARELGSAHGVGVGDLRLRITGDMALATEEMTLVARQAGSAGVASLVLVGIILTAALRRLRPVLSIVLTLLVGLVWAAGFAAAAVGHLNLISVAFAVLFIGLSTDFGLHLALRQQELRASGSEHEVALQSAARDVGPSIALCATSTAIGFYAFVPTDFVGVAELGMIAGTGMFISLFATFTVLPAALSIGTGEEAAPRVRGLSLPDLPLRKPRGVAAGAALLGAASLFVLPHAAFDPNPLNVRDPSAESVRTYRELLAESTTSPWSLDVVASDLGQAEHLAEALSELEAVAETRTVADYLPADQDEKLALLEEAALFLAPAAADAASEVPAAHKLEALRSLERALANLASGASEGPLRLAAERAAPTLARWLEESAGRDPQAAIAAAEEDLLASLPDTLARLERLLAAGRVTSEGLPEALRARMVAEDGRVRVRVFPADALSEAHELGRFVDEVRRVSPNASGPAIDIVDASRAVVAAFQQALVAAVVAIALILLLLWRSLSDAALVLAALLLASVWTGAATALLGIPFNFADVIVLPLILGIGVDSGIHLVHRARLGDVRMESLMGTSTARAVVFASLTTIASFGSLGFASHRGIASLGQLLTLGVVLTLVANLFVLPALIALRKERTSSSSDA